MIIEDLLELINQRTSIRSFTAEEISNENLIQIAKAGRASPTDSNKQQRKFIIIKNNQKIRICYWSRN